MTSWASSSPASTTWISPTINNTDIQEARIIESSANLVLLNTPKSSAQITELNYSLRLVEKVIIDGYSFAEIDASAEEYWEYMYAIYIATGLEIDYWNASIAAGTVPENTLGALQSYIISLMREKTFWYQNSPSWIGSGAKGKEWELDYIQAYYNNQPNTTIQARKILTYTEEVAMLTQKVAAMDTLSALGFNLTHFIEESSINTTWTEI